MFREYTLLGGYKGIILGEGITCETRDLDQTPAATKSPTLSQVATTTVRYHFGFRVKDLGFRVKDLGSRVKDLGFSVKDLGSRV